MRRIFFDANVIIAGSMSRGGASRALLMLAEAGMFRMIVSRQVLDEVERNLRDKMPKALPVMAELLSFIAPEIVDDPPAAELERWHGQIENKDAPILEAAIRAEIDFLVTLNSRDFTPYVGSIAGLTIVSPGEMIARIREIVTGGLE
jgi:predicted nucleic acid-binding protein